MRKYLYKNLELDIFHFQEFKNKKNGSTGRWLAIKLNDYKLDIIIDNRQTSSKKINNRFSSLFSNNNELLDYSNHYDPSNEEILSITVIIGENFLLELIKFLRENIEVIDYPHEREILINISNQLEKQYTKSLKSL